MSTQDALNQMLDEYYRDFSSLDIQAIVPYYHEPCLLVSPQGVIPVPDRAALAGIYTPVLDGLQARGYGHSQLAPRHLAPLSAVSALASGVAVRYKADGQELERVGISYLLQKSSERWLIAMSAIHDVDKLVRSV